MHNIDEVVSKESASALSVKRRPIVWVSRNWDVFAVLLLLTASLPLAWVSPHSLVPIQHPGAFDDHWVLDAAYKTSRGIYFGREVGFIYGPIAHWLLGAPARIVGLSLGTIYTSYRTLVLWCTVLFGFLTLRLLLPKQPSWRRFLLLTLLTIFWTSWDGRTSLGIFLFALFLRGWYAVREGRLQPAILGCGAAVLTSIAFWYSADTGVYGVAALLIALAGVAWEGRREWRKAGRYAKAVGAFAVSSIVLVFAINTAIASPLDFHFWRSSLALVAVHRWNEPAAMSEVGALHLLVPFIVGSVLFVLRLLVRTDDSDTIPARTGFLLSSFVFALLAMQSGLVRSDPNHIVFGVFPMVFFSGVILFSFHSRLGSAVAAVAATACSLVFSQPIPIFQPQNIHYRLTRWRHPLTSCPDGFREFDGACYPTGFAVSLENTAAYLQQRSNPQESVVIFPYQYMFGVAARRNVAANVEQTFLANGAYLSQFDIDGMQQAAAPVGLYFPDAGSTQMTSPTLSLPIDGISNFSRTPSIWLWLFHHYRSEQEVAPGIFGLLKDDSRNAKILMQEQPLTVATKDYPILESNTVIDLGAPEWPASGADFLRLRLRIRYNSLWKLRKPEWLKLEITRADGSRSVRSFVLEPNVESEAWFYPWNEADLSSFFDADESRWRPASRPAVTRLRLLITPLDWFSQKPESITIESADAVRFSLPRQP